MSKNIVIQEAGLPKALTVDALKLNRLSGGSDKWRPSEGRSLVQLDIGGSGTYKASDYNAYGISVARVEPKYGGGATSKAVPTPPFAALHNVAIQEGGKTILLSAAQLNVNNDGGGTSLWVPEDEIELKTKYITQSGTYPASADECYGFSEVTVSGIDVEITTDDDGDDVARITDGGDVTDEKLPSSIRVTVLPRKIDYTTGETIDYTGLVVHAYARSGIDLGVVPFNELILPAEKAGEGWSDQWTDGHGLNAMQIAYTQHWDLDWRRQDYPVYVSQILGVDSDDGAPAMLNGGGLARLFVTRYNGHNYAARLAGDSGFGYTCYYPERETYKYDGGGGTSYQTTLNQFTLAVWEDIITELPESTVDPTSVDPSTLYSIGEAIPVQWHRPRDGELLETSFNIYTRSA